MLHPLKRAVAVCLFACACLPAQEPGAESARAKAMREIAAAISVQGEGGAAARPGAGPLYRFDDPTRDFSDGTIWAYGSPGRPLALVTISLKQKSPTDIFWLLELNSIADGPLKAVDGGREFWHPDGPGLTLHPIPKAAPPADTAIRRLRQLRELARRFHGYEVFESNGKNREEQFDMRLLPQPAWRYSDPDRGLIDGAIFLLVYGQNPEVALIVEARRAASGGAAWSYGLARISSARLHVDLDGDRVADFPQLATHTPTDSYGIAVRPARGLADKPKSGEGARP